MVHHYMIHFLSIGPSPYRQEAKKAQNDEPAQKCSFDPREPDAQPEPPSSDCDLIGFALGKVPESAPGREKVVCQKVSF